MRTMGFGLSPLRETRRPRTTTVLQSSLLSYFAFFSFVVTNGVGANLSSFSHRTKAHQVIVMMLSVELQLLFQNSTMDIVPDNAPSHRKRKLPSTFADSGLPVQVQELFQYEPCIVRDDARGHKMTTLFCKSISRRTKPPRQPLNRWESIPTPLSSFKNNRPPAKDLPPVPHKCQTAAASSTWQG